MEEVAEYTAGKLMDPRLESKEPGSSQLREGPLERMLGRIRRDEYLQQLVTSKAVIAAPSKKKGVTTIVSRGIDTVKFPYPSDTEHIKVLAQASFDKKGASGGSGATLRPFADGSRTKLAEACRRFLINPGNDSDRRRGAAEGRSYLTLGANVKEKPGCDEPATRALMERGKSGAKNGIHGVVATLVDSTNSYSKQENNPEILERAKVAKPNIPEEH